MAFKSRFVAAPVQALSSPPPIFFARKGHNLFFRNKGRLIASYHFPPTSPACFDALPSFLQTCSSFLKNPAFPVMIDSVCSSDFSEKEQ